MDLHLTGRSRMENQPGSALLQGKDGRQGTRLRDKIKGRIDRSMGRRAARRFSLRHRQLGDRKPRHRFHSWDLGQGVIVRPPGSRYSGLAREESHAISGHP
jgi:hypothetical protein